MINSSTLPTKAKKNPLYYLWSKWSQPSHQGKYFGRHPSKNTIQYNEAFIQSTIEQCCNEIMKRGLETEGLFRQSGATFEVLQLQRSFSQHQRRTTTTTTTIDLSCYDIHTITSFLKKYLQHLPIIPPAYHDAFLSSTDGHQRLDLIRRCPLLGPILTLVGAIQQHVDRNRMDPEALAVILAPVCAGPPPLTVDAATWIQTNARWTHLWEWIIEHHHFILESLKEHLPLDLSFWYTPDQLDYTITPPPHEQHPSYLSSGISLSCRKSSHGFLRRLTSLSSLR